MKLTETKMTIYLTKDMHDWLREEAYRRKVSINQVIREAIRLTQDQK